MGGPGSGWHNKPTIKSKRYKVFGCYEYDATEYFYLGTTLNYLCNIKSYLIYASKKQMHLGNPLFDKIRSINFKFNIEELEMLPKEFTFEEAKLYLQEHYLDNKTENLLNKKNFCFCRPEVKNHHQPKEIKQQIIELYQSGVKTKDICEAFNLRMVTVQSILTCAGQNKKAQFMRALEEYKNGKTLDEVACEYNLTNYLTQKIYQMSQDESKI